MLLEYMWVIKIFLYYLVICSPIIIFIYLFNRKVKKDKKELNNRCTFEVNAVCTHQWTEVTRARHASSSGENDDTTYYYNRYSFNFNGNEYQVVFSYINNWVYHASVGEEAILRINPNNPYEAIKLENKYDRQRKAIMKRNSIIIFILVAIVVVWVTYINL